MKYHSAFLVVPMFVFSASVMSAVAPTITKVSVTPTSATAGTMFKFSAELNTPLPEGYKVKIAPIGLTGFTTMISDVKNSYALSRAIYTTGKQTYKVVIVNAKNVTQGSAKTGSYTITSAAPTNHAPTLTLIKAETTATTSTAYTVKLNAKDVDANLNSITMNWGDNSEPETITATYSKDLVFSHSYTTADSFGWNAFASDKGTPVLNSKSVSQLVTISNPVPVEIIEPPIKTSGYTKIANNGLRLPDSATLGTNPTDWACTKDNNTGLVWEVKTTDGGLRDMNYYYANYDKIYPKCDETGRGISNVGYCDYYKLSKLGESTNTDGFVKAVNKQSLCGANNWRMPTRDELNGLIYCSDGKYNKLNEANLIHGSGYVCASNIGLSNKSEMTITSPTINTTYFPDITNENSGFWSSSSNVYASKHAWIVYFNVGGNYSDDKDSDWYRVRLVR